VSNKLRSVITSRDAPPALVGSAVLITEMKVIKHAYVDQAIKAQAGIEF
jgi:cob(I)alamin adenosyltransferase